jgi:hypothetical protein
MDYYPAIALVAVIGGFWGWAGFQRRRFRRATAEAAARLNGRYEARGAFNGGSLHGKVGDRDVVISFQFRNSSTFERTIAGVSLRRPVEQPFELKGRDAVARAPVLRRYTRLFGSPKLHAKSHWVSAEVPLVIRDSGQLMELAGLLADMASRLDSGV